MKKVLLVSMYAFSTHFVLFGQDSANLKRPAFKLKVSVDKNSYYEANIESTPYVLPNKAIQLYPGESVYVEVDQVDGKFKNLHAVSEIQDSSKTLTIAFSQITISNIHKSMMLKIVNPLPYKLKYTAKMLTLQKKWVTTDVLPVEAGLTGFESWPNVIVSIALGNWDFKAN
jgi:hypothetical protein